MNDPRARREPGTGEARMQPHCILCGFRMIALHCKYECHNCGFRIDCSDHDIEPDWRVEETGPRLR